MPKHTPGHWSIERYVVDREEREVSGWTRGDLKERVRIIADEHPPAFIVADMVAGSMSDAHLLAAAPDLLAALERVTELLNDPGVGDLEQWKRDCREWTAKARAAVAAARGEGR